MVRGSRADVARPNVPAAMFESQLLMFTRLNRLNVSMRSWVSAPSARNHGTRVFLMTLKSTSANPGPR